MGRMHSSFSFSFLSLFSLSFMMPAVAYIHIPWNAIFHIPIYPCLLFHAYYIVWHGTHLFPSLNIPFRWWIGGFPHYIPSYSQFLIYYPFRWWIVICEPIEIPPSGSMVIVLITPDIIFKLIPLPAHLVHPSADLWWSNCWSTPRDLHSPQTSN